MKKSFLVAVLALLVLSACSSVPPKQAAVGTAKQPVVQQPTATVNEGEVAAEVPTSRFGDNMKCDVLKNAQRQQECEMQINDMIGNMLESEIISSFDVGRCSELPADNAPRCQERLGETGVKGPVSAEEMALFHEITRGTVSEDAENPGLVYNSARCGELKTEGYKAYCEKQMAERADQEKMSDIIRSDNKNRCNELTTESMKNDCKRFFGEEVMEEVPANQ